MTNEIMLVGGGGHCRAIIDILEASKQWNIVGIVDPNYPLGESAYGYRILGNDSDLNRLIPFYCNAIISVGQLKSSKIRNLLYSNLKSLKANLPVIISPYARVSSHISIDEGTVIHHNAVVNFGVKIGKCAIVNTGAVIEHDVTIGDFCHVSTGVLLNGSVSVGNNVFIGSGAIINQGIKIASGSVIGSGALVLKNISIPDVYTGVIK